MQEKIKEYLDKTIGWINDRVLHTKMAKDITEIANQYYRDNNCFNECSVEKENTELKKQLKDENYKEFKHAFRALAKKRQVHINQLSELLHKKNLKIKELNQRVAKLELDRILKLDRDKIIDVLKKYLEKGFKTTISGSSENGNYSSFTTYFPKQLFEFIETIADEIINK